MKKKLCSFFFKSSIYSSENDIFYYVKVFFANLKSEGWKVLSLNQAFHSFKETFTYFFVIPA